MRIVTNYLMAGLLFISLSWSAANATATMTTDSVTVGGYHFATTHQHADLTFTLVGKSHLVYAAFIDVLAGALYLPPGTAPNAVLEPVAKRLEFAYMREFTAEELAKATWRFIRNNNTPEQWQALQSDIDRFNALYQNIKVGDRYVLTYLPGQGTSLSLNGKTLGEVQGASFASVLFSVWFGAKPFSEVLKQQLMGES